MWYSVPSEQQFLTQLINVHEIDAFSVSCSGVKIVQLPLPIRHIWCNVNSSSGLLTLHNGWHKAGLNGLDVILYTAIPVEVVGEGAFSLTLDSKKCPQFLPLFSFPLAF